MGTWIKETDKAIYLMDDNYYIDAIFKRPSTNNPKEQVANITTLRSWFAREDKPRRMTVAVGTGAPEPEPVPRPPSPPPAPDTGSGIPAPHNGMQIRVKSNTFFKQSTRSANDLPDQDKVFVREDTVFNIEYYTNVGNHHWQVELLEPTLGNRRTTSWYVFAPHLELLTGITLTVTSDTLFKLEPKLSIDLPAAAKVLVKNGTRFTLVSYEPAAGSHTLVELAGATLGSNNQTRWYVFNPDIKLEGQRQTLEVVSDTLFKTRPVQSSQLPPAEKFFVKNRTVFLINSYAQPENLHVRVALQGARLGPQNRNTWYCFVPDIMIAGTEIGNHPADSNSSSQPASPPGGNRPADRRQPATPRDRGIPLRFPGFDGTYYANDPIYPENQYGERGNFTWGEAVHANPTSGFYRRPANADVVYSILRVARVMEDIRRRFGNKPIQINSWYRDPATNAAVGGSSQSRHMAGDAVDFVVPGVHPYDVYANLDRWWGSRGGLASSTVFTHIDVRGYRARWSYGY